MQFISLFLVFISLYSVASAENEVWFKTVPENTLSTLDHNFAIVEKLQGESSAQVCQRVEKDSHFQACLYPENEAAERGLFLSAKAPTGSASFEEINYGYRSLASQTRYVFCQRKNTNLGLLSRHDMLLSRTTYLALFAYQGTAKTEIWKRKWVSLMKTSLPREVNEVLDNALTLAKRLDQHIQDMYEEGLDKQNFQVQALRFKAYTFSEVANAMTRIQPLLNASVKEYHQLELTKRFESLRTLFFRLENEVKLAQALFNDTEVFQKTHGLHRTMKYTCIPSADA